MADTEFTQFFGVPFMIATQGCGFPEGGSLNFAKSIEQKYIDLGGKIHYNSKVEKILVRNNETVGIRLENGKEVKADIVISAADGYTTIFKMLDGKYINKKIQNCYESEPTFPTYLQVSIGLDMELRDPNFSNSIYNFYKLEKPIEIAGKEHRFLSLKNYAFDPTFSPEGKTTLVAGFSCKFEDWEKLSQNSEKYLEEKEKTIKEVVKFLDTIIPGIEDKIEAIDVATPLSIVRYTNNWKGSYMGWANPFSVKVSKTLPKLKNFFMVGQWVGGTGVSGAAQSGRDCLEYICIKNKKQFITTTP
jgi:phytoene dehydrogenase-like protein